MIKRWTIHLEIHWGYWPKFYIRPQPKHGERHVDGGVPGTLVRCNYCSGQGFLHQPDSFAGLFPEPAGPITNAPKTARLELGENSLDYQVGETVWYHNRDYVVKDVVRKVLILERKDDSPHIPPESKHEPWAGGARP